MDSSRLGTNARSRATEGQRRSKGARVSKTGGRESRLKRHEDLALAPDFRDPLENSIPFLLRRTSRYFRLALQARLRLHGLGFSHWFYLRALWLEDGITQRELCRRIESVEPAAVTALAGLDKGGYVKRIRDVDNRRQVKLFITPKGRALEAELVPFAAKISAMGVAGISEKDLAVVRKVLNKIRGNMAAATIKDSGDE